jgi:(1->4)-alpha-D-glucan 1-alpha-D-glucosylmutase
VTEKILDSEEELPAYWPVEGTTGYDYLNAANGVFCRQNNENRINRLYEKFTGSRTSFADLVRDKKRMIIGTHMAGDIDHLAHIIKTISNKDRYGNDITLYGLRRALVELLTMFPIYRTYVGPEHITEEDKQNIRTAITRSQEANPSYFYELNFLERFLLLQYAENFPDERREQWLRFVMRFQQYTGPLMAKGFEDTALYIYNRLSSLNEVGGNPENFGTSAAAFHRFNGRRGSQFPFSMNATATHDTKRGEDVRARIHVLSEIPERWEEKLTRWSKLNRPKKITARGREIPDRNDEYLLYQTLLGTYPFEPHGDEYVQRIQQYAIKAAKEAKVHTSWLRPNEEYEQGLAQFAATLLNRKTDNAFFTDFLSFQKEIASFGVLNSLSQTLLKITSPGIPDFYQGTELWDFNLVDPDNRRPVRFDVRRKMLQKLHEMMKTECFTTTLLDEPADGMVKLFTVHAGLRGRAENRDIFEKGEYIPLTVEGSKKDNLVAFARKANDAAVIVCAPRFYTVLAPAGTPPMGKEVWGDTAILLPESFGLEWKNYFTGETVHSDKKLLASDIFNKFVLGLFMGKNARARGAG